MPVFLVLQWFLVVVSEWLSLRSLPTACRIRLRTAIPTPLLMHRVQVHGCIVNIDMYNHLYLNPFDGKLTPYYATDMEHKIVYPNMQYLLKMSPNPPLLLNGISFEERYGKEHTSEEALRRYEAAVRGSQLPILSKDTCGLAVIPQVVLDKSMYKPSKVMRAIQYLFDSDVIRIWNDAVLDIEDSEITERQKVIALPESN